MTKTIRARYREGKLELLEPLEMEEGAEVTVTVNRPEPSPAAIDPLTATAGAWKPAGLWAGALRGYASPVSEPSP